MAKREHIINKIQELLDKVYKGEKKERDYLVATGEVGWVMELNGSVRYGTLYIIPQNDNIVFRLAHTKSGMWEDTDPVTNLDVVSVHDYAAILTIEAATEKARKEMSIFYEDVNVSYFKVISINSELIGTYVFHIDYDGETHPSVCPNSGNIFYGSERIVR